MLARARCSDSPATPLLSPTAAHPPQGVGSSWLPRRSLVARPTASGFFTDMARDEQLTADARPVRCADQRVANSPSVIDRRPRFARRLMSDVSIARLSRALFQLTNSQVGARLPRTSVASDEIEAMREQRTPHNPQGKASSSCLPEAARVCLQSCPATTGLGGASADGLFVRVGDQLTQRIRQAELMVAGSRMADTAVHWRGRTIDACRQPHRRPAKRPEVSF